MNFWKLLCFLFIFSFTTLSAQEWKGREDWPTDFPRPAKSERSLFYIQRNKNINTIVYDLNFKKDGQLDRRNPIDVYWRKYRNGGVREEVTWLQSMLAYGYNAKLNKKDQSYRVKLRAYNKRYITLKEENGEWRAIIDINGIPCYLNNIYAYADESGVFPDVKHVDVYGVSIATGENIKERIVD